MAEANAELSTLIASLSLGSDALSAEEFQNFPNEEQVSFTNNLFLFVTVRLLIIMARRWSKI